MVEYNQIFSYSVAILASVFNISIWRKYLAFILTTYFYFAEKWPFKKKYQSSYNFKSYLSIRNTYTVSLFQELKHVSTHVKIYAHIRIHDRPLLFEYICLLRRLDNPCCRRRLGHICVCSTPKHKQAHMNRYSHMPNTKGVS